MKILLAKRRALGDTVLLASAAEVLAARGDDVYALVPAAFSPVLEGNPAIKKIFTFEEGFFSNVNNFRKLKLDYYIRLHAPPHGTFRAKLSGAKKIIFHEQNKETEIKYGRHPNALEWDGFLFRELFGENLPIQNPEPKIYLSGAEREAAQSYWRGHGVDGANVVMFGLGASRNTKRWPAKYFARLAELLRERMDLIPAIITGPGEEEEKFAGQVLDQMRALGLRSKQGANKGDFIHMAGLSLRKLIQFSSTAKFYVGNDSGPKHIALATGIPTFTFFGPEDPLEWHPYSLEKHPVFFEKGLGCRREDNGRWCSLEICNVERHKCMEDIRPEEVATNIQDYFRRVNA